MANFRPGNSLDVLVVLLVSLFQPAVSSYYFGAHGPHPFSYSHPIMPSISSPYSGMGLSSLVYPFTGAFRHRWRTFPFSPSLNSGHLSTSPWARPSFRLANPRNDFYRQWGYHGIPYTPVRSRAFNVPNVQNTRIPVQAIVPTVTQPVFKAFTKAPVFKTANKMPQQKQSRVSVVSGPLRNVRPSPAHNNVNFHMRKKAKFKSVAKAKPFHHLLSGTALGLNKMIV